MAFDCSAPASMETFVWGDPFLTTSLPLDSGDKQCEAWPGEAITCHRLKVTVREPAYRAITYV